MKPERTSSGESSYPSAEKNNDYPAFNPEAAKAHNCESFFHIDPSDYPIFSQQGGIRKNSYTQKPEAKNLNIHETLGLMVGRTAETIGIMNGENPDIPPTDHVIYLDKSARPVSWLIDEFWDDCSDSKKPSKSFLAIDRRVWFPKMGLELLPNEYVEEPSGATHVASPSDVDKYFGAIEKDKETLARIRALYIEGGIETEDPDTILQTPTVLDGKNLLIIDEVERSGSTLHIAKRLLKAAIPELKSVNGHVFWTDNTRDNGNGEQQMGFAPVWYPQDHSDWRGRGVKDINPVFFENQYNANPTPQNRALKFGAIVLGEPLTRPEDEPGQLSWHLREEIHRMHEDYCAGHILPTMTLYTPQKVEDQLKDWGIQFVGGDEGKANPHSYIRLSEVRDEL